MIDSWSFPWMFHPAPRKAGEVADLGYCWTGTLSNHYSAAGFSDSDWWIDRHELTSRFWWKDGVGVVKIPRKFLDPMNQRLIFTWHSKRFRVGGTIEVPWAFWWSMMSHPRSGCSWTHKLPIKGTCRWGLIQRVVWYVFLVQSSKASFSSKFFISAMANSWYAMIIIPIL